MNDYDKARIEEIEADKASFLKIINELGAWLEVTGVGKPESVRGLFDPEYQTADMRVEILGALDSEEESIREEIPADYTTLGRG